jgi:hypothetical protein
MYGDALVPESSFDYLVDESASPSPLAPPNLPIGLTELIRLRADYST